MELQSGFSPFLRIEPSGLTAALEQAHKYPHETPLSALSITQPTEAGFCYTLEQVKELSNAARAKGLK